MTEETVTDQERRDQVERHAEPIRERLEELGELVEALLAPLSDA